jgi:hypothetical protein
VPTFIPPFSAMQPNEPLWIFTVPRRGEFLQINSEAARVRYRELMAP